MTPRVVQVNCVLDPQRREPETLLDAWWTLPTVAEATARAGADMVVVQASHAPARFSRRGVQYRFVQVSAPALAPWRLARAVRAENPDVIHLNGLDFPLHARLLSGVPAPLLAQDHASNASRRGLGRLRRWGYRRIAGAAFTAAPQADPFLETGQLRQGLPIFAIPECSSDFTPGARDAARYRTGVHGDPALLWIGHLNANKDPLTMLRAAAQALESVPDLQLWVVFVGTYLLREVETLLHAFPALAARTHLLGRMPHARIQELCRACDLFVSGSHREGSGYALIEALACGLPPVVSDIASFRALTGNGAVGALVPPGDAEGFARAIVRLAAMPRGAMRHRVRAHFEAEVAYDVIGRRLLEAYSAIAPGGSAA